MKNILGRLFTPAVSKTETPFEVQRRLFGNTYCMTIFDVGAYIGKVASVYKKTFPYAAVYCFEPFPESFQKLSLLCCDKSINAYNLALSDKQGKSVLCVNTDLSCNSFYPRPKS